MRLWECPGLTHARAFDYNSNLTGGHIARTQIAQLFWMGASLFLSFFFFGLCSVVALPWATFAPLCSNPANLMQLLNERWHHLISCSLFENSFNYAQNNCCISTRQYNSVCKAYHYCAQQWCIMLVAQLLIVWKESQNLVLRKLKHRCIRTVLVMVKNLTICGHAGRQGVAALWGKHNALMARENKSVWHPCQLCGKM